MSFLFVALDIDGTLLTAQEELRPRVQSAIEATTQGGVHVTLATGRRLCRALPWAQALALSVPIVVHNGAVVACPQSGRVIHKETMDQSLSRDILQCLLSREIGVLFYPGDEQGDEVLTNQDHWQRYQALFSRFISDDVIPTEPHGMVNRASSSLKISVLDQAAKLEPELKSWQRQFGSRTNMMVFRSQGYLGVEFVPAGCSKATGVAFVLKQLGLSFQDTLAVGDDINDLELIRQAKLGVAMANAVDELKLAADVVAKSNQEDGVAHVLEQFVCGRVPS